MHKSGRLGKSQFVVVQPSYQVKSQPKSLSPIAIFLCQNYKYLKSTDDVFADAAHSLYVPIHLQICLTQLGCVAKNQLGYKNSSFSWGLSYYSKDFIDESDLSHNIAFLDTLHLPFSDHIHGLKSSQRPSSRIERPKSHPWFRQTLDEAMILLNQVIQIFDSSEF